MALTDRIHNPQQRTPYLCEACGSADPRPVTHKTWCSVRIAEPSLHRFVPKDMTRTAA